jgi:uncharacterized protein
MFYLDTSFAVSLLTEEKQSDRAKRLLQELLQLGLRGGFSDWTQAEFRCAITAKYRAGTIPASSLQHQVGSLDRLDGQLFDRAPVLTSDITRSGMLALKSPNQALRAADALHLVIATRLGATHFLTFDHHQASAARALMLGVEVIDG